MLIWNLARSAGDKQSVGIDLGISLKAVACSNTTGSHKINSSMVYIKQVQDRVM